MRDFSLPCKIAHPRDGFATLIPDKPYCVDMVGDRLKIRDRKLALQHRHIQLNGPATWQWMPHDLDRSDAYFAHRDANLPPPNFIAINPANGHGHSAILLDVPVARHSAARDKPIQFYAAVERGFARRLGADRAYVGLIVKNPMHEDWRVEWRREEPYTLPELADWLFFEDMRPDPSIETTFGAGRNVTVFDELRQIAYREVKSYKTAGSMDAWFNRCLHVATGLNQQFPQALRLSEVRGIAKSVSSWTWRNTVRPAFSRLQSYRGKRGNEKRWAGHQKQCLLYGLNERTYRRRKKAGTLPALPSPDSVRIATSDNSPSWVLLPFCPSRPVAVAQHPRWPHLVRSDGFGRVPIDLPWAKPMRAIAAAVAAGKAPFRVLRAAA